MTFHVKTRDNYQWTPGNNEHDSSTSQEQCFDKNNTDN